MQLVAFLQRDSSLGAGGASPDGCTCCMHPHAALGDPGADACVLHIPSSIGMDAVMDTLILQ